VSLPWKRRRAREIALQLIYELRVRPGAEAGRALASFPFEDEEDEVVQYASLLVRGVAGSEPVLDGLIRRHVVGWRPERMVAVDRAAVELALYEGWVEHLVPVAVAISEAVELAKVFGTEDSGRFVNGVLGRIVRAESGQDADGQVEDENVPPASDGGVLPPEGLLGALPAPVEETFPSGEDESDPGSGLPVPGARPSGEGGTDGR
jgi:N utilization substance protein B